MNVGTTWNHMNPAPYYTLGIGGQVARLGLEQCVHPDLKSAGDGLLPAPQANVEGTWRLQTSPSVSAYVTICNL